MPTLEQKRNVAIKRQEEYNLSRKRHAELAIMIKDVFNKNINPKLPKGVAYFFVGMFSFDANRIEFSFTTPNGKGIEIKYAYAKGTSLKSKVIVGSPFDVLKGTDFKKNKGDSHGLHAMFHLRMSKLNKKYLKTMQKIEKLIAEYIPYEKIEQMRSEIIVKIKS